jgi:hypothetical protein
VERSEVGLPPQMDRTLVFTNGLGEAVDHCIRAGPFNMVQKRRCRGFVQPNVDDGLEPCVDMVGL